MAKLDTATRTRKARPFNPPLWMRDPNNFNAALDCQDHGGTRAEQARAVGISENSFSTTMSRLRRACEQGNFVNEPAETIARAWADAFPPKRGGRSSLPDCTEAEVQALQEVAKTFAEEDVQALHRPANEM